MKAPGWYMLVSAVTLLTGCGGGASPSSEDHGHVERGEAAHADSGDHGHEHSKHEEDGGEVAFSEGRGLTLSAAVRGAMELKTAAAEVRPIADNIHLMAQVFATEPQVLASAKAPADHADHYEEHEFTGAKLLRIDRSAVGTSRLVELIIEIERSPAPALGEFIELEFAAEPIEVLTVPASALLDAATGTFVYVENGEYFLRAPVKVGARSPDFIEITDGLYEGDVVVASPVEQLWLTELRLTKGGGHSH